MAVFSRVSTKLTRTVDRLSVMVVKTKAKIRHDCPRGAIMLSAIKVSATVAGKLLNSVSYMQGIVDAANEVVAYAEMTKSNRKECKELAALVEELMWGLLAETEGVKEDDLSERARLNLAKLEWKLETTRKAMEDMRKTTLVWCVLLKDEHAAQLADRRRALGDALGKFQMKQCIRADLELARIEKKQDTVLDSWMLCSSVMTGLADSSVGSCLLQ